MPVLSLSELLQQLDDARQAYNRAVVAITAPYVRDKFTELADKSLLSSRATWLPDGLPVDSLTRSETSANPMLDGLEVHRVISPKEVHDVDVMKCKGESIFTVLDRLIAQYVDELVAMEAKRVDMPVVYVKNDAFEIEVFVYGFACVEPKP